MSVAARIFRHPPKDPHADVFKLESSHVFIDDGASPVLESRSSGYLQQVVDRLEKDDTL